MSDIKQKIVSEIKKMFSDTDLGNFKTSVKAGKNFGKL